MKRWFLLVGVALLLSSPLAAQTDTIPERQIAQLAMQRGTDSARFHAILDAQWRWVMREFPTFATDVGWPGRNDRWADNSEAALQRRRAFTRELLTAVQRSPVKRSASRTGSRTTCFGGGSRRTQQASGSRPS